MIDYTAKLIYGWELTPDQYDKLVETDYEDQAHCTDYYSKFYFALVIDATEDGTAISPSYLADAAACDSPAFEQDFRDFVVGYCHEIEIVDPEFFLILEVS